MAMDVLAKKAYIGRLRIKTIRLLRGILYGEKSVRIRVHSGLEFDTLRDYASGDDVRHIDWNSTARGNKLVVRSYWENRDRAIVLFLDCTSSMRAGSGKVLKSTVAQEIASVITLAAEMACDSLGLVLYFGDRCIEIPLRSRKEHYTHIIDKIVQAYSDYAYSVSTDRLMAREDVPCTYPLPKAVLRVHTIARKNALILFITDGIMSDYEQAVRVLAARNTVAVIRIIDRYEHAIPKQVLLMCHDPETKTSVEVDGVNMRRYTEQFFVQQERRLRACGVRYAQVYAGETYDAAVRMLFVQGI